jgi:hypothetical protein
MKYFFIYLFLLFSLISAQSFGQTNKGTIKGKVFDPEYGNIIGANILLLGTNLGAAADSNGSYVIRNVPFGQYAIKCTYIGYPPGFDTINVTNENSEVILDFELTIPKIPIVMPDSLQQYHNLISTLDPSEILEINIDSVSKNFDYTYLTITNNTEYPIYLIEDMLCFNTVDEILKESKGEEVSSNIVNLGCDDLGAIELPKLKNLIIIEPFSTKKFPPVRNYKYRMINSPKMTGKFYLSIKYQMRDYKYIPPYTMARSFDDYYAKHKEEIYVLNRATRGIFYSKNSIIVNLTPN